MDEDFSGFLHSQFSEAFNAQKSSAELSLLLTPNERYINKEILAEGGQKKIYKCTDVLTGRTIAYASVKNMEGQESLEKFIREARLTAHLEHPHIIPVYDSGSDDDNSPFFTMKLISGKSFEDYLKEEHSLNSKIDILIKSCEAISFAHSKGIIHFDIKPENIQVSDFGEVLVCDWGLAGIAYEACSEELLNDDVLQEVDMNQSLDSLFKGTPGYAAPEMWEKNSHRDHLADVYSLGATLYQILTKKRLKNKSNLTELSGPEALQAVCLQALSKKKEQRYQSSAALLKDLQSWRDGFATQAEQAGFTTHLKLLVLRHRNVCRALFASILTISTIIIFFMLSLKQKEKEASKLADNLQIAEFDRNKLEQKLLPRYLENAYTALEARNYSSARALCEHILRNSQSPKAKELIALSYLCEQKFKDARPWLTGSLLSTVDQLKLQAPLKISDLANFISKLNRNKAQTERILYKNLLFEEFQKQLSLGEKRELIIAELLYKHPKLKKVYLELQENAEGLYIDLSNNPSLREIFIIQKLGDTYIKNLNFDRTPVSLNSEIIEKLQIESLSLQYWPQQNLAILKGRRILHLNVAHSKLDASTFITEMPLVTLDISHSSFSDWTTLKSLKFLKTLTVSKDQIPAAIRTKMRNDIEVLEK